MARLRNVQTGAVFALPHHTRVGRSQDADLRIDDRRVSGIHALIEHHNDAWEVRDLGSRNGTRVGDKHLPSGTRHPLRSGAELYFGSPEEKWVLEDDSPPDIVLIDLDSSQTLEAEHGHMELSENQSVYTRDGFSYWFSEGGDEIAIQDGSVIVVGPRKMRVSIPPPASLDSPTMTAESLIYLSEVTLEFDVSRDEEHVQVTLSTPHFRKPLRPRSFDYMLLALARARLADQDRPDLHAKEQGWVFIDELAQGLGLDVNHINVDIYRARKRFRQEGIHGADQLIERRPSTRAIRLGCPHLVIRHS